MALTLIDRAVGFTHDNQIEVAGPKRRVPSRAGPKAK